MASDRRVVITGLGVATPVGIGIEAFWDALIQKRCGIRRIEDFDPSGLPTQIAGELPAFSIRDVIHKGYRKSIKVMSRDIMIAVVCAYHAVKDAGLKTKCLIERGEAEGPPNVDSRRFGANIGAGHICPDLKELAEAFTTAEQNGRFSLTRWGAEGINNLTPLWLLKFLPNMLACHVTIVHDAQAPSNTITCQEASGHLAIGEAFRTILRGDADVCICGGAENKVAPMAIARPQLWERLNTQCNESPQSASRPFGADRAGMVASAGGGLVILESLEHAKNRDAGIYAEVVGFGAATDTTSWTSPDPNGKSITLALRNALRDADIDIHQIDLVNPLGAGTIEHDRAEMAGWNEAFGERLRDIHALTTRGNHGNNGAGSGAIEFTTTVMAQHRNTVPPSYNTDRCDDECRFQFVQGDPIDAPIRHAISLGFAFAGGQAGALITRRFEE